MAGLDINQKFAEYWIQQDRMKGMYLSQMLRAIEWAGPMAVTYNLSPKRLAGHISHWMQQNQENVEQLWHDKELHPATLPKKSNEIISLENLLDKIKFQPNGNNPAVFEFDHTQMTAFVKAWYEQKEAKLMFENGAPPVFGKNRNIPELLK